VGNRELPKINETFPAGKKRLVESTKKDLRTSLSWTEEGLRAFARIKD
jgi:hypothetical protein